MARFRRSRAVLAVAVAMAVTAVAVAAPSARADGGAAFTCGYTFIAWPGGFSADVRLANHGPAISGWTVELRYDVPTTLGGAWASRMAQPDPYTMTAEHMAYNETVSTGGAVTFGWVATTAVHEVPAMSVNGVPC